MKIRKPSSLRDNKEDITHSELTQIKESINSSPLVTIKYLRQEYSLTMRLAMQLMTQFKEIKKIGVQKTIGHKSTSYVEKETDYSIETYSFNKLSQAEKQIYLSL